MTLGPVDAFVLLLVIGVAVAAAVLRDVLAAIIAFAAYSLGMSVIWVLLRAPDVALTEAAVGAGVMTLLLLLTIAKTTRPAGDALLERPSAKSLVVAGVLSAVLLTTVPNLPAIGDPSAPVISGEVTQYYLENAKAETEVSNFVTAVLAAYRGFDTLGEAVVVFAAGVGLLVVLDREAFL